MLPSAPIRDWGSLAPIITTTSWGWSLAMSTRQLGRPVEVVGSRQPGVDPPVQGGGGHSGGGQVVDQGLPEVEADRVTDDQHPERSGRGGVPDRAAGRVVVVVVAPGAGEGPGLGPGVASDPAPPRPATGLRPGSGPGPRSVQPTTWESPSVRLNAAIGPTMSRDTVRRAPSGDTWADRCRLGASRSSQTPKHDRAR